MCCLGTDVYHHGLTLLPPVNDPITECLRLIYL